MSIEQRMEKLEYYCSLMLDMIAPETKPFYALVIRHGLTKEEVEHTLRLCEQLSEQYKQQKEEGFVIFTSLFHEFASALHPNLPLAETIDALKKQQLFVPLMTEFQRLLHTFNE
ncbi:YhaI family protein [Anoxybacillus ayderensis]|uniref:YhaI family protein n=1 Tax=Anoxybacillus ayderensis TaxID=265546 RepID=UPI002E1CCA64|nr:YhaI family protein [Anoxybacillus ayderensis]